MKNDALKVWPVRVLLVLVAAAVTCALIISPLQAAGAFVPDDFDKLGEMVEAVYKKLVEKGTIMRHDEPPVPKVRIVVVVVVVVRSD